MTQPPQSSTRPCHFCGEALNPDSTYVWHRIIGWERKAHATTRRSGSDIALRERRDLFACDSCIRRQQRGVNANQGQLA